VSDPRLWRTLAVVALALIVPALTACAGGGSAASSSSQLTPADVQRYVLVKEATANLTRLIGLIGAADNTVQLYSQRQPRTTEARNLLYGSRLGWNAIVTQLNAFTQAQGLAVPEVTAAVSRHKNIATTWQNALDTLAKHPPHTIKQVRRRLAAPQRQELKARHLLQATALALARETCSLGIAHPGLATSADTAAACGTAKQLAAAQ
jgi:hypothetical protein